MKKSLLLTSCFVILFLVIHLMYKHLPSRSQYGLIESVVKNSSFIINDYSIEKADLYFHGGVGHPDHEVCDHGMHAESTALEHGNKHVEEVKSQDSTTSCVKHHCGTDCNDVEHPSCNHHKQQECLHHKHNNCNHDKVVSEDHGPHCAPNCSHDHAHDHSCEDNFPCQSLLVPRNFYGYLRSKVKPQRPKHAENIKDFKELLPWLWIAIKANPTEPTNYTLAAYWLKRSGVGPEGVKEVLLEGLSQCPGSIDILFELILIERNVGDLDMAVKWVEQGRVNFERDEVNSLVRFLKLSSVVYEDRGDFSRQRLILLKLMELFEEGSKPFIEVKEHLESLNKK